MALQAAYQRFLAAPDASLLATDASLHYITTLTSVNGSAEIIKHLKAQGVKLKKKEEKFLDTVEGASSIASELHTTLEFISSGGSYLPGLDDNFLADRTVTFPIIHIVNFDAEGKIQQIRQNWDQGSLLKLIDVIGKTGRNWPIRDGKDQIKLIVSSVKSSDKSDAAASNGQSSLSRARDNSTNPTRDPHASLSLFGSREEVEQESLPAVVAPRASAKPEARDLSELFVGNTAGVAKAGSSKKFAPSRLFEGGEEDYQEDEEPKPKAPIYRPNPARYDHFDIAEGHDEQEQENSSRPATKGSKGQHQSQWGFDDFMTPQKAVPTKVLRAAEVRHWGTSDDEVMDSPVKAKRVDKPRKDAEPHFEFQDDGTPQEHRATRPRGTGQNNGLGLYNDTLMAETPVAEKPTTGHANAKDRRKDFDSHFSMTDDSPVTKQASFPMGEDRAKAVKMMDANWDAYDSSPVSKGFQKENNSTSTNRNNSTKEPLSETTNRNDQPRGIMTAGDGMGGKKAVSSQNGGANKGIATTGDGMGGKKGKGRSWGFGDDSDGEETGGVNGVGSTFRNGRPGKAQQQKATGGDFWDF